MKGWCSFLARSNKGLDDGVETVCIQVIEGLLDSRWPLDDQSVDFLFRSQTKMDDRIAG